MKHTKSRRRRIEVDRAVLLKEAKRLAGEFGWSILPVRGKKANLKSWRQYQRERPTEKELVDFFDHPDTTGLAAICGAVSECLVARDFDRPEAYDRWRKEYPDYARLLPTSQTGRGNQVFCRSAAIRRIIEIGDGEGELRGNGYVVLPPSLHPKGALYRWLKRPELEIPLIDDPASAGLLSETLSRLTSPRQNPGKDSGTNPLHAPVCVPNSVDEAILATLPRGPGQRNRRVFWLALYLRMLLGTETGALRLRPIVRDWHSRALQVIQTKGFDVSWTDFVVAWRRIKGVPLQMQAIVIEALNMPEPPAALLYDDADLRLLVRLCDRLQHHWGTQPFFLSCRKVQQTLSLPRMTAWRMLQTLQFDGVIKLDKRGRLARPGEDANLATTWWYLGLVDDDQLIDKSEAV